MERRHSLVTSRAATFGSPGRRRQRRRTTSPSDRRCRMKSPIVPVTLIAAFRCPDAYAGCRVHRIFAEWKPQRRRRFPLSRNFRGRSSGRDRIRLRGGAVHRCPQQHEFAGGHVDRRSGDPQQPRHRWLPRQATAARRSVQARLGFAYLLLPRRLRKRHQLPYTTENFVVFDRAILSLKYSHALTDAFGLADSRRSDDIDACANREFRPSWILNGHVGRRRIPNTDRASYSDWKLGITGNPSMDLRLRSATTARTPTRRSMHVPAVNSSRSAPSCRSATSTLRVSNCRRSA